MAVQKETFVIGGHLKMRRSGSGLPFQKCGLVSTIQTTIETNNLTLATPPPRRAVSTTPWTASLA